MAVEKKEKYFFSPVYLWLFCFRARLYLQMQMAETRAREEFIKVF